MKNIRKVARFSAYKLHSILEELSPYIYGGKCIGSGGDGSVQIICENEKIQKEIADKYNGLIFTIKKSPH